jgi:AcrR family transcriptional regulator
VRRDARSNLASVLAAAAAVFAERGLAVTLADVAAHAGVGVGTVYRRFPTKDDLIHDVYADRVREWEVRARAAAEAPDPWEGFTRYFEQSARELAADRGLRELTIGGYTGSLGWSRGTAPDRLAALLAEGRRTLGVHLAELVSRAKAAGALREDFEAGDMLLLSLSLQAALAFGGVARTATYRRVLTFLLDGLRPARADLPALRR